MLISKFNKLIRNKIVWAAFAFFVSLSFVISFSAIDQGGGGGPRPDSDAGTVFGEGVSYQDFNRARLYTLSFRSGSIPEDLQDELRARTWERLVTTRTAAQLGLQVPTEEVQQRISQDPTFSENGNFDVNRYKAVVRSGLNVPEELFEDFYRETILMEKFYSVLAASTWITPAESDEQLRNISDLFTIEYALFDRENFTADVEVTDADLEEVYEESGELFRVPEKVRVSYVTFPFTNVDESLSFTETEISEFYDANQEFATVLATNISTETITTEGSNTVDITTTNLEAVVRSLDEMRDAIVFRLRLNKARDAADDVASNFIDLLLPPDGRPVTFDDAAAKMGLEIGETDYIGRFDLQSDLEVSLRFNSEALGLDENDPQRSFSNPVEGDSAFYVLSILDRRESYLPDLEEVRDDVTELTEEKLSGRAFDKYLSDQREELKKAVADGTSFAAAAADVNAEVTTNVQFSVLDLSLGIEEPPDHAGAIMPALLNWESGEISTAFPVPTGGLLVHVAGRMAAPFDSASVYRDNIAGQLARERTETLIRAWGEYSLTYGKVNPSRGFEYAVAESDPEPSSAAEGSGN